jgi:hypothetical protein
MQRYRQIFGGCQQEWVLLMHILPVVPDPAGQNGAGSGKRFKIPAIKGRSAKKPLFQYTFEWPERVHSVHLYYYPVGQN